MDYGSAKGRNTLFLILKSLSLAVFCLSCLCRSPWQRQPGRSIFLSSAPTQTNSTRGQKQSLLSGKQENMLSSFLLLPTAILFSVFLFSLWCIGAEANLSHSVSFTKQQTETRFISRCLSRQPDQPYCLQVGIFLRHTSRETQARTVGSSLAARTHVPCNTLGEGLPKQHLHWIYE